MANAVPCAPALMGRRHHQKKRHPGNSHALIGLPATNKVDGSGMEVLCWVREPTLPRGALPGGGIGWSGEISELRSLLLRGAGEWRRGMMRKKEQ